LIWCKGTGISSNHRIHDTVRGVGSTLSSNQTSGEDQTNGLGGVLSNGFNLISSSNVNQSFTYVAWCWRAAGSPASNQAKIINADGTQADTTCAALATAASNAGASNVITPSKISANRQNGFSITAYSGDQTTGATISHGLNSKPELILLKRTNNGSGGWNVYHKELSDGTVISLDSNAAMSSHVPLAYWNNTPPDNNVVTLGYDGAGSEQNDNADYIMYCWHSVSGYSKCGSYTSNNSNDGNFVYLGFRPSFVMIKAMNGSSNSSYWSWAIYDNARKDYNPAHSPLYANLSVQEDYRGDGATSSGGNTLYLDFLSNGFKIRNSGTEINGVTTNYIYIAFAEQSFSGPSNAP
jgi:hypothetical protein